MAAAYDLYFGEETNLFQQETIDEDEKRDIEIIFEFFESTIIGLHLFEESKYTRKLVELYMDYQKRQTENNKQKLYMQVV